MKQQYVEIFDVIYNEEFTQNNISTKWANFNDAKKNINGYQDNVFFEEIKEYLKPNKGVDYNIIGIVFIKNSFMEFNERGIRKYYELKMTQLQDAILFNGRLDDYSASKIFNNMDINAIKKIIIYGINNKYININGLLMNENKIEFKNISMYNENNNVHVVNNYTNSMINNGTILNSEIAINEIDNKILEMLSNSYDQIIKELSEKNSEYVQYFVDAVKSKNNNSILNALSIISKISMTAMDLYSKIKMIMPY